MGSLLRSFNSKFSAFQLYRDSTMKKKNDSNNSMPSSEIKQESFSSRDQGSDVREGKLGSLEGARSKQTVIITLVPERLAFKVMVRGEFQ